MGRNDQAVTAPVDVLAAMDAAIHKLGAESSGAEFAGDLLDARAAVDELIEALSKIAHLNGNDYFDGGVMATRRIARAALARAQGGAA